MDCQIVIDFGSYLCLCFCTPLVIATLSLFFVSFTTSLIHGICVQKTWVELINHLTFLPDIFPIYCVFPCVTSLCFTVIDQEVPVQFGFQEAEVAVILHIRNMKWDAWFYMNIIYILDSYIYIYICRIGNWKSIPIHIYMNVLFIYIIYIL